MAILKVVIESAAVEQRSGTSATTGKPYNIRRQETFVEYGRGERKCVPLNLALDQPPYPPGEYTYDARSFEIGGKYNDTVQTGRDIALIPYPRVVQSNPSGLKPAAAA